MKDVVYWSTSSRNGEDWFGSAPCARRSTTVYDVPISWPTKLMGKDWAIS